MGLASMGMVLELVRLPRRWGRARWLFGVVVLVGLFGLAGSAKAEDCSHGPGGASGDFGYNAACGPEYESPGWGDAGGWTSPSQYSTIKLADITGNGQDELLARNSDGLEIWRFDTSLGEWRPAIGANGNPEVLSAFRSPLPSQPADSQGADPMTYSTIQTADVWGDGRQSIIAMFPDGVHTWDYAAPKGTKSIDGGTWSQEGVGGPTGNLTPAQYLSMHVTDAYSSINLRGREVPAMLVMQDQFWWHWQYGKWEPPDTNGPPDFDTSSPPAPASTQPSYYLDEQSGDMSRSDYGPNKLTPSVVYRTANGVGVSSLEYYSADQGGLLRWFTITAPGPLSEQDCSNDFSCFGSDPSRYETMRLATGLRGSNDTDGYVLGRLSNGLHVYAQTPSGWDTSLPVLSALKDSPQAAPPPGTWSSIRTGDVTGDGRTDVLALVNGQLQAWELKPNGSGGWEWSQLPAQVPLNLGQSWETNASYYSTIQVGPVAGAGYPDGVIARGPFGIRTWFYCSGGASPVPGCASLDGKSGWTSFLPQGSASYPRFTLGQGAAWTALNALAHNPSNPLIADDETTVRDVWTATNAASTDQLTSLSNGLALAAGCSGATSVAPPTYPYNPPQSGCKPPTGSSGFTAADWTAVVNETLADIYYAKQIDDYYDTLGNLRRDIFLAEGSALPAIGSIVQGLAPAAGNASEISPQSLSSTIFGIAGSIAGVLAPANPGFGAALSVASYILAMIPSDTPDLTGPSFSGTFADLQNRFAAAVSQADKAQTDQSYDVRSNWGLLRLIGQLTSLSGAWHTVDSTGIKSAAEEGYVLTAYKQLLPTVYDRYVIVNCRTYEDDPGQVCRNQGWRGQVGTLPNFTTLGLPPNDSNWDHTLWSPCTNVNLVECFFYSVPSAAVATQVWGPVSDACNYNGNAGTQWTYGDPSQDETACNLGVDPALSVDYSAGNANGWNFTTCWGNPYVSSGNCAAPSGVATAGPQGSLQLTASTRLPRGFRVTSVALPANRVLLEPQGLGNLLSAPAAKGSAAAAAPGGLGTIHLTSAKGRPRGGGHLFVGSARDGVRAALILRTSGSSRTPLATVRLQLSDVQVGVPDACQQLPATVTLASPKFTLDSSLVLTDGHSTRTLSAATQWTCQRNRTGTVTTLHTVTPQAPARRPGLTVSISGPKTLVSGTTAIFNVKVRNTRRGPRNRDISSLWSVRTQTGLGNARVVRRLAELRRGAVKTLIIRIHIPARRPGQRLCVAVAATALSARPAAARTCAAVARVRPTSR